ncbi:ZinT/AdcA family metal-binding protein [Salmonella enterica subsp. enterica]|nr:ZinT/AdcA family metal-binding protein [Salmonella enterica subsp. enterica]
MQLCPAKKILTYASGKKGCAICSNGKDANSKSFNMFGFSDHIICLQIGAFPYLYGKYAGVLQEMENWPTYYRLIS